MKGEVRLHNTPALDSTLREALAASLPEEFRGTVRVDAESAPETVLDMVEANAARFPDKLAYRWIGLKGKVETAITFKQMWQRIDTIAWHLQNSWGASRGDCVLLVYPPGLDFVFAHMGCLRAGCVAVPVYPPELRGSRAKKGVDKLALIAADCNASVALTTKTYHRAQCECPPRPAPRFAQLACCWRTAC